MDTLDDELRDLLRERAVPPAAPPTRYDAVRRRARTRQRRTVAATGVVTGLVLLAAVGLPLALRSAPAAGPATAAAVPSHPPAAQLTRIEQVVAYGSEIVIARGRGACTPEDVGVAWLADGSWQLAVWTPRPQPAGTSPTPDPPRVCTSQMIGYTLRLPLSRPYAGEPVVDAASGSAVEVNGGPGFPVPSYLPPGYTLSPGSKGGIGLAGPHGGIELRVGGPEVGTILGEPGWPYDLLDRPDINGRQGTLIRYRNDGDNTVLAWTDGGTRGFVMQVFSATLDPQELVKIARSMG